MELTDNLMAFVERKIILPELYTRRDRLFRQTQRLSIRERKH